METDKTISTRGCAAGAVDTSLPSIIFSPRLSITKLWFSLEILVKNKLKPIVTEGRTQVNCTNRQATVNTKRCAAGAVDTPVSLPSIIFIPEI